MAKYKGVDVDTKPTEAMAKEAQRGLDWRAEFGRGGTAVGVARARQLINRQELSPETVKRMASYFARHEVDKQGEGYSPGEDGYPSAGRIAWALWGGNSGQSWANARVERMKKIDEQERGYMEEEARPYPNEHAARISDPAQYDEFSREADAGGSGVDFIYGIKEGESELQAIRFDADVFSEGEAREWLEEHELEPIEFEAATVEREMEEEERFDRSNLEQRSFHFEPGVIDEEHRTVRLGVSSEEPVERSFGLEVIDHRAGSMDLSFLNSGRAPLLLNHDMERQIGVVESVQLDEDARRLRALVRFSRSELGESVWRDVVDQIMSNVSVGYRIDGRIEEEGDSDDVYRVRTTPMEVSIVSLPADRSQNVGVGRSASQTLNQTIEVKETSKMADEINLDEVRAEATQVAHRNASEIMKLARRHNKADLGDKALERGISVEQFRGELLDAIESQPLDVNPAAVEAKPAEKRQYSLGRMVQAQVRGDWSEAGFEREMHQEIERRTGKASQGVYVPDFAWRSGVMTTAATGGISGENVSDSFVPTIQRGDLFIEALRAKQVMANLGVTFMGGLTNRISIPKIATGAAAGFVEEAADVSDQSPTDAAVTLQPRTLGAYAQVSRLLALESIPSIEQIVQDDLLRSIADKIEYYAIQGSGSSGQPTGILNNGSVGNVDISASTDVDALTWADITTLVQTVEQANGVVNQAALGWLSNPKVKAKLANTARVGSTDSVMLLNDPWNNLYGYRAEFTSNVPSDLDPGDGGSDASALIFGDFSQLMVGLFGAPSVIVDPYTNSKSGDVVISIMQEVDVALRNAVSFAKTDEVSTA